MKFSIEVKVTKFDEVTSECDIIILLCYDDLEVQHKIDQHKCTLPLNLSAIVREWESIAKKLKIDFRMSSFAKMLNDEVLMNPKQFYNVMDLEKRLQEGGI